MEWCVNPSTAGVSSPRGRSLVHAEKGSDHSSCTPLPTKEDNHLDLASPGMQRQVAEGKDERERDSFG